MVVICSPRYTDRTPQRFKAPLNSVARRAAGGTFPAERARKSVDTGHHRARFAGNVAALMINVTHDADEATPRKDRHPPARTGTPARTATARGDPPRWAHDHRPLLPPPGRRGYGGRSSLRRI